MLGAEELALLPSGAVLINIGRAEVVDEAALYEACSRNGGAHLAYGSDVWWKESASIAASQHTFGEAAVSVSALGLDWAALPNVVMTPHFAGAAGFDEMEDARADALVELL